MSEQYYEIFTKVSELINEVLKDYGPAGEISPETKPEELGLNSITFVKLAVLIENEFGIEFDDESLEPSKLKTVGDIIDYIQSQL
jgi:acyl carrier protein